jgi:hypothetical protein
MSMSNLNQAYIDLINSAAPDNCRIFGGGSESAAELMDGARVPNTPTYVYRSFTAEATPEPVVYVYAPDTNTWNAVSDGRVYSNDSGIVQLFAVPDDPPMVWIDFGAGKTSMDPVDTALHLSLHTWSAQAHPDMRQDIAGLRADVDNLDGQSQDIDDIRLQVSDLSAEVNNYDSRITSTESTASNNSGRITDLEGRVSVLETDKPCLRQPVLWDMSGELGTNVSKHRYTNLHEHEQEITMFYVEADSLVGTATVNLLERNPSNGSTSVIATASISGTSKTARTANYSYFLDPDLQIVPEIILNEGTAGLDLTVQVYLQ